VGVRMVFDGYGQGGEGKGDGRFVGASRNGLY
jgi:hypothetical protein